jgi:hypothetical protein
MKRAGTLWIAAALLPAACTHTQVLELASPPEAYERANRVTAGRDAEVLTRQGQIFRWYDVRLAPDVTSALLLAGGTDAQPQMPTAQIAQVSVRSRSRGLWEGALIGAGVGAALGALIGPDDNCAYYSNYCVSTRTGQAAWGAGSGALWGVIVGAIRASRTRIRVR